ncbi:MAG TPA: TlpA disulfide reductase family protein [Anditalea sp.]|nr:TlpA disulfide reductase family protein [Anditalea sp.]
MKKLVVIVLIVFPIIVSNAQEKFSLSGKISGYEDSTYIFLEVQDLRIIDSALVENEEFEFKTKLDKAPIQSLLRNKNTSQYKLIWLEDKKMTIDGVATDLMGAEVKGSETEAIVQEFVGILETKSPEALKELENSFMQKYNDNIFCAFYLSLAAPNYGKERTKELFSLLSEENKESEYGMQIKKFISLSRDLNIGDQFVDFTMPDLEGKERSLSDHNGKVVLLEFWATWCSPCIEENPNLRKTYNNFKPKGFEIFAVSLDKNGEIWRKVIANDKLNWLHVSELTGFNNTATNIYNVYSIPDNFLIDQKGIIIGRNLRGAELDKQLEMIFGPL